MPKQKALLVDDSKSARFFLRNMLQKNEIEVEMAESGEAALEYLKVHRPDIIFMDHLMPGIDGFKTTESIKANPATSDIPVVMCTSNEGEEYVEQARSIGATDILSKPPTEDKLVRILGELSQRAAMAAPTAPAAAAPALAGPTREEIQALVRDAAQSILDQTLEPLVDKVLAARLESVQRELAEQGKIDARQLVNESIMLAGDRIQEEVLSLARDETQTIATAAAENAAASLMERHAAELHSQTDRGSSEEVEAFRNEWANEKESLLQEAARLAAEAKEGAASAARDMARYTANESASTIAEQAADRIAREVAQEMADQQAESLEKALMGKIQLFAGAAAGVGVLAAILLKLL